MDPGAWPVRTGTTVKAWHRSGERVVGVTLSDGSREEVDLVLLGVGIDPNLELPVRAWATQRRDRWSLTWLELASTWVR
jgi:NAD(P)H-nitrite reductase large subunit